MADPVVHITNGVPDSGTGNITTLGAVVTALGSPMQQTGGSVIANAGTNLNTSTLAVESGGNLAATAAVAGVTSGTAVVTDANGTLQQYLRGLVKLFTSLTFTSTSMNVNVTNALAAGRNTPANSSPVVLAKQDYQDLAASTASTAIKGQSGASGAAGDWLDFVDIFPESTSPGQVTLQDGSNTAVVIFAGGASSVASLVPFSVAIRANSANGAWNIVTGAAVHVRAVGNFT